MIDLLVDRVKGTSQEVKARYTLARSQIYNAFYNPQRDPVFEHPVKSFARDALLHGLALYEASIMRPGYASHRGVKNDNILPFR